MKTYRNRSPLIGRPSLGLMLRGLLSHSPLRYDTVGQAIVRRGTLASRRGERGSAFIIALMILILLTFVGLSLSIVTETEMLLGASEKLVDRTCFAAETGFSALISQLVLAHATDPEYIAIPNSRGRSGQLNENLGFAVDTTNFYPIVRTKAPYSNANEDTEKLYSYFFLAGSRARRVGWDTSDQTPFEDVATTITDSQGNQCTRRELRNGVTVQTEKILWSTIFTTAHKGDILGAQTLFNAFSACQAEEILEEV